MLATSRISRKVVQLSYHLFGVNLHTFYSEKQISCHLLGVNLHILQWKAAQLAPFWC